MEEGAGKNRRQVREHLANKSEGPRRGGREHVAVRHLNQILEPLTLERQVQVPEGLLLRDDYHVILRGVLHQFLRFFRSDGPARSGDVRQARVSKSVFHVGRDDVDFVFRQQRDIALEGSQGGNGTAADVQAHAAPADGRPIDDPNLRRLRPTALYRMEQLPQCLHPIENARRRLAHNGGFMGSDHQDVTFLVGLSRDLQPRLLQNLLADRAIGTRQNNARRALPLAGNHPIQRTQIPREKRSGKAILFGVAGYLDADARPYMKYSLTDFKLIGVGSEWQTRRINSGAECDQSEP